MSWIRSSERAVVLAVLLALVAAAGPAVALSVSAEGVPEDSQVGDEVNATVVIEDPFTDQPGTWELRGGTELRNVSWTVTVFDQGQQVGQATYGGQSFNQTLRRDNGGDEIRIEIAGTTPGIEEFSYDPRETYTFVALTGATGNNTAELESWSVHHYTNESREARNEIAGAETALENVSSDEGNRSLGQAISAYDSGNFENAISNAEDARRAAEQTQQSRQTTQMALYGVGGIVALSVIVGGVWYYRKQQDTYDKLR